MWNKLSMANRAKYIQLGVANGITDINTIRDTYNSYADGGYEDWIDKVKKGRPGIDRDIDSNNPTYDYKGFYEEDIDRAWRMLEEDSEAHFTDKFKRPNHPTFSDESIYSNDITKGGHWIEPGNGNSFYVPSSYTGTPERMIDIRSYLTNTGEGYLDSDGVHYPSTALDENIGYELPELLVTNRKAYGGRVNKFDDGGDKNNSERSTEIIERYDPLGQLHYYRPDSTFIDNSTSQNDNVVGTVNTQPATTYSRPKKYRKTYPYHIDKEGNKVNELPEVIKYGYNSGPLGLYNSLYSIGKSINDNLFLNEDDVRVHNMQDSDMRQFYNLSPRKITAGMDLAGSLISKIPSPHARTIGLALQAPNLIYDTVDFASDPTAKNGRVLLSDALGLMPFSSLAKLNNLSIPSFNMTVPPVDSTTPSSSVTVPEIPVGKGLYASAMFLRALNPIDNIETLIGRELTPGFEEIIDPDTIKIGTNPFTIDYQKNVNREYKGGGKLKNYINKYIESSLETFKNKASSFLNAIEPSNILMDSIDNEAYNERERKKKLIGHIIKDKEGNIVRVNSDLTQTKLDKTDRGYEYITSDGKRVIFKNTKNYETLGENKEAISEAYKLGLEANKNRLSDIKNMNSDKLKEVQSSLAEEGYYSQLLRSKSKKEIKDIQRKLHVKDDGIVGPKTEEAFINSQIDGKYGKNTEGALHIKYNNNSNKVKEGLDGCAQFVTNSYEANNGEISKQNGVIGDAWTMPFNIVNKGGKMKYNLYDDKDFDNIKNINDLKSTTLKKAKTNKLDYNIIELGDIVGIFMPSSDMHEVALKNGTTKNTHVGYIVGFDEDGMPLVRHNIHTSYRTDRADKITGSKSGKPFITVVSSPKTSSLDIPELHFEPKKSTLKINGEVGKDFHKVMDGMQGAVDTFQKMFKNIDVNDAMIAALAVQQRETNMGKKRESDIEENGTFKEKSMLKIRSAVRSVKGLEENAKSSNQMKMKLSSLLPYEQKMLGITSKNDLENPYKAGIAALYIMCKNMDYFTRLSNKYPELGIEKDDIESLTMLSYNQGMNKLRSIGFNDYGIYAPNELSSIRHLANSNTKIRDISATNYKYLGNTLGNFLYNLFEDSYTPYIARAKQAKSKIKNNQ